MRCPNVLSPEDFENAKKNFSVEMQKQKDIDENLPMMVYSFNSKVEKGKDIGKQIFDGRLYPSHVVTAFVEKLQEAGWVVELEKFNTFTYVTVKTK